MLQIAALFSKGIFEHLSDLNWPGVIFQFFLGYIPQGFAAILFIHVVVQQRVQKKVYILSSLLMGTAVLVIREILPINFGVHTIMNILILILICCGIHKFPLIKTCIGSFLVMIILYVLEGVNYAITLLIFGQDYITNLMAASKDPIQFAPAWMPPSFEFVILVLAAYLISRRRKAKQDAKSIEEDRVEH